MVIAEMPSSSNSLQSVDMELCQLACKQAGVMIRNACLFSDTQDARDRDRSLITDTIRLFKSSSRSSVIKEGLALLARDLQADHALLFLPHEVQNVTPFGVKPPISVRPWVRYSVALGSGRGPVQLETEEVPQLPP